MHRAALRVKKDAGTIGLPVQKRSAVMRVALDESGRGKGKVAGKTHNLIRVNLDFLMAAAEETLLARKEEGRLSA